MSVADAITRGQARLDEIRAACGLRPIGEGADPPTPEEFMAYVECLEGEVVGRAMAEQVQEGRASAKQRAVQQWWLTVGGTRCQECGERSEVFYYRHETQEAVCEECGERRGLQGEAQLSRKYRARFTPALPAEAQRTMVRVNPCPFCEAPAGQPCVRKSGRPRKSNHKARVEAAQEVEGWSPEAQQIIDEAMAKQV